MPKKYTVVVESDEEGWLVSEVVGLPGCHTQAKDMCELLDRTREAISAYVSAVKQPKSNASFVGVQLVEV